MGLLGFDLHGRGLAVNISEEVIQRLVNPHVNIHRGVHLNRVHFDMDAAGEQDNRQKKH